MSRKSAIGNLDVKDIKANMKERNIYLRSGSDEGLLEEAPEAYKNVSHVVDIVCKAGLTGKVVKLRPIGVVKG